MPEDLSDLTSVDGQITVKLPPGFPNKIHSMLRFSGHIVLCLMFLLFAFGFTKQRLIGGPSLVPKWPFYFIVYAGVAGIFCRLQDWIL